MATRSSGRSEETAGEIAQMIASQRRLLEQLHPCDGSRCQELLAHERTLVWLMDRLRQETAEGGARAQDPLQAAQELADVLRFEVPPSHRGFYGVPVTVAKRGVVRAQTPFLIELMRPQFAFNREVVGVLEQLTARQRAGSVVELSAWVGKRLRSMVDPTAWDVRSPRQRVTARAVETVKQGYLRVMSPLVRELLDTQRQWNELLVSILVTIAGSRRPETAEAAALIARLEALSDPLRRADNRLLLVRASKPFWREVFRRQIAFNHEVAVSLANLLETHAPAGAPPSLEDYPRWFATVEPAQIQKARAALGGLPARPLISLAMPVYRTPEPVLRTCIDSVLAQRYEHWELCIADDGSGSPELTTLLEEYARKDPRIRFRQLPANVGIARATNAALEDCRGEYVGFIDHDDSLAPHALAEVVLRFAAEPELDWVYSDEDRLDAEGRRFHPFFKPDWSPELLRACNYICHFVVVRRQLMARTGGLREGFEGSQDYDFLLRLSEHSNRVGHIPRILYHWRYSPLSLSHDQRKLEAASRAGRRALAEHLARCQEQADVVDLGETSYRVRYRVRGTPLVSIIVPFKDKPELLDTLVRSLLEKTRYPHFELLLVSNQSSRPETFALLERLVDPRIRKLNWDEPFNYPAINNFAARQARGELLLFLNNDMEVTEGGWLEELIAQAQRPEVGAVAPKLLFPDGCVQHAGVVVGITGFAGHPFWRLPNDGSWTPFGHADWPRNYLAVTSACMMVRRELFEELGGYDESFQVVGSDIEVCLRMVSKGLRVVYTPYTRLTHHESASRRLDAMPEDDFWRSFVAYRPYLRGGDPFYNPNLTLSSTSCDLRWHSEDGEALALRTLAWELPGARAREGAAMGRYRRHLAEHLPGFDSSPLLASSRRAPAEARPPRRMQWLIPAADRVTPGLELVARMASLMHARHHVENRFIVYDAPWQDAHRMEALLTMAGGEGHVQVLRNEGELAELPACDVVIATHWTASWLALNHPGAAKRAYLVQDFEPLTHAAGTLYSLAEQSYRLELLGLFNSPGVHAFVTRNYPLKGVCFEPTVDPLLLQPRPAAGSRKSRLLCLAHPLVPESGFEMVLPVLRRIKQELSHEVEILCAGQAFEPERFDAGGVLESHGVLTPREAAELYRTCDVALGLSFTLHPTQLLLDVMASGVAVVVNDNPAFRWLLEPDRNCLVSEPTASELTRQVLRCLKDRALREQLAAEARRRMGTSTWEEQVDRVYAYLSEPGQSRDDRPHGEEHAR
ncbi:rhamnosyltransferase WsaF family glycosyltransferase [Cystobacter fuscus]|nr:glycosyltransferase [Cystobacter fuscus]